MDCVAFYLPINYQLMPSDATTENHGISPHASARSQMRLWTYTHTKCHRMRGKIGAGNLKLKTEDRGRWSGEEDNEKKGGGVKSRHCSLRPGTTGLQPCTTLIHHYRFAICRLTAAASHKATCSVPRVPGPRTARTAFDLKHTDWMNRHNL